MTLTVYFYDRAGVSLASPETIRSADYPDPYDRAFTLRRELQESRGVRVYLHTVEGP